MEDVKLLEVTGNLMKIIEGGETKIDINIAFFDELSDEEQKMVMDNLQEIMNVVTIATQNFYHKRVKKLEGEL